MGVVGGVRCRFAGGPMAFGFVGGRDGVPVFGSLVAAEPGRGGRGGRGVVFRAFQSRFWSDFVFLVSIYMVFLFYYILLNFLVLIRSESFSV